MWAQEGMDLIYICLCAVVLCSVSFFLCFSVVWYSLRFLFSHLLFCLFEFSLFFLGESGQRCVNFVYPFKEPALGFIFFESLFLL